LTFHFSFNKLLCQITALTVLQSPIPGYPCFDVHIIVEVFRARLNKKLNKTIINNLLRKRLPDHYQLYEICG
jgi:hypothetical protein